MTSSHTFQGTEQITPDTRTTIEQEGDEIVLSCRAAKKADQGKYAVTLKNNLGSDTALINVTVLGLFHLISDAQCF